MTLQDIQTLIEEKPGVLLYFSGATCNVCHALRPKYKALFDEKFPLIEQVYLDAHEHSDIAVHFNVFSVPTAIVFLGGREFAREGRAVSLHQLEEKLSRPYDIMTEA